MVAKTETVDEETGEVKNLPAKTEGGVPPTVPGKTIMEIARAAPVMPVTPFAKLAEAISSITAKVAENPIHKKGKNSFHNYSYATMQDILTGLTPMLAEHGVVIMQNEIDRGFMDNGNAIFATYDFTIMHKSGEVWPFPQRQTGVSNTRTSKGTFDDKGINKCHTAARKYFLLSLFQIPTTDEDDADKGHNDSGHKPRPPKAEAKPAMKETVEKLAPCEIERPAGITAAGWGGLYIEQIGQATSVVEVGEWRKSNLVALNDLKTKAARVYEKVEAAELERIAQLTQP